METDLTKRVTALEQQLAALKKQQITFPLDDLSIKVLMKYFMRLTGTVVTAGGASGNASIEFIGSQDDKDFIVSENPYTPYTVNVSTDVLTAQGATFPNDTQVVVASDDTAPAGLTIGTTYWVINSTGSTFKLSTSMGGSAVNITAAGTGRQYILFLI